MSVYDDDFRLEMLDLQDELAADLTESGLMFREDALSLVVASYTGADAALGVVGTQTLTTTEIQPRPKFTRRDQFRTVNGAPMKIGDAVAVISRSITRAALEGASWFLYGTERYVLVPGEIKMGAFFWTVVLRRDFQ